MRTVHKLPDLAGLSPKFKLRAWEKWKADQDEFPEELEALAEFVRLSIKTLILNEKQPSAFAWAEKKLAEELAAFGEAYRLGRG